MTDRKPHNLNIHNYSLEEIFGLFQLSIYDTITTEDIKRAKKIVLMTHPDKSHLSPDYFLFYKKAFEFVIKHYESINRQNKVVPNTNIVYQAPATDELSKNASIHVKSKIQKMSETGEFQHRFNQLFEENMKKPVRNRNEWFQNDSPAYNDSGRAVSSVAQLSGEIDRMKQTNQALAVSRYNGVQDLTSFVNHGSGLYDDDDYTDGADGSNDATETYRYLSSNIFGSLKYDDLRRVHKDQTIIPVSERDYANIQKHSSVDSLMRERGNIQKPLTEDESRVYLQRQDEQFRTRILKQQYKSDLETEKMKEKNQSILSQFFLLGR